MEEEKTLSKISEEELESVSGGGIRLPDPGDDGNRGEAPENREEVPVLCPGGC